MEPASIIMISIAAATLAFNIWQSHRSNHFASKCFVGFNTDNEARTDSQE